MLTHSRISVAVAVVAASVAVGAQDALADATATSVTPSAASAAWGQSVELTATVADTTVASAIPTGSVQFSDGATPIGSPVTVDGAGHAKVASATLAVAQHTISAAYTPNVGTFDPSNGMTTITVARAATATTLGAAPNPAAAGQDTTFSAAVTVTRPGAGTPTGVVQFAERGGFAFDTVGLDSLAHASTVAYAFAGLYTLDANYFGDMHFNASSGSVATRVTKASTSTLLTISPNPAAPGATISFSAVVAVQPPGDVAPTGSLQFTIDGAPVGAAVGLGNGVIGYQGSLVAPPGNRTYLVAVSYSGDDDTEPSSASVAVTVAAPALAASATSVPTVAISRLSATMSALTTALRLRGFAALTTTTQTLTAGPGVLEQKVYSPAAPKAARAAAKSPVLIASGSHRFATTGAGTLRLKLTSAGRRAIRHAKSLKLAIVTRFTPKGGKAVVATKRLTVRARPKRSAGRSGGAARGWRVVSLRARR
jgi:Bacterial Ig-like domain (group 3)